MSPASRRRAWSILALACAAVGPGCSQFGSRQRLEEGRRYIQALRSQNDQLKDQLLAARTQNQDYAERAVDDARRLAVQTEVVEDLRRSVHAYQAERDEYKTAFRELRDSLPSAVRAALSDSGSRLALRDDERDGSSEDTPPEPEPIRREERYKPRPTDLERPPRGAGWAPADDREPAAEPGLDPAS